MKKSIIATTIFLALATGCASNNVLNEQQMFAQYPVIQEANTLLNNSVDENLALYSPEQMKQAQQVFDEAVKQAQMGKNSAIESGKEVVLRVRAAQNQASKAKYVFEDVFKARQRAEDASASRLIPDAFNDAETKLAKMLSWLEIGEDEKAKRDINTLKTQYLDLELKALKSNMLSFAEQALARAKKDDVNEVAPRTMSKANDEYQLALATLGADRTNTSKANVHSNQAIWLVNRAKGIVDINIYFKNAKFDEEQKILWYQEQLTNVMSPLNSDISFDQPNKEVIADLRGILTKLLEERQSLNANIVSLKGQLNQLEESSQAQLNQLKESSKAQFNQLKESTQFRESKMARVSQEALLSARLELEKQQQENREDDDRFASVQSLFTEDEATVYRQINNVLIRAQGFSFKPGSSEIDSTNFAILNKIIAAIKQFPEAKIVVSGHTDTTGSADLNLELSTARAQTVTSFITQVGLISSDRLSFKGFGKEKPVATNETAEGRAQNRRVEILIVN
jgi:outer membrane protein OmpA-like peptidoglycan-associated protein